MTTAHPYRLVAIADALTTSEGYPSIARKYSKQWNVTERTIYGLITHVKQQWRSPSKPPAAPPPAPTTYEMIGLLMLREAISKGENRANVAKQFAERWNLSVSYVDSLILQAIKFSREQIDASIAAARVKLEAALFAKLSSAREMGDYEASAKIFAELASIKGLI